MKNIKVERKGTKTTVIYERKNKPVKIYYNGEHYATIKAKKPKKDNFETWFVVGLIMFFGAVVGGGFFFKDTTVQKVEAKEIPKPIVIEKIVKVKDDSIPPILKKIAECESGGVHTDKNGRVIRGKTDKADIGKYQISLTYHKKQAEKMGLDLFKESDNEKYALWLFENQGSVPWKASSSCWIKK